MLGNMDLYSWKLQPKQPAMLRRPSLTQPKKYIGRSSRVYLMSTMRQMASRLDPSSVFQPQWDPVPPSGALMTWGLTLAAAEQLAWTLFFPSWNSFRSIGLKKEVLHALAEKSLFSRCDVLPLHLKTRGEFGPLLTCPSSGT